MKTTAITLIIFLSSFLLNAQTFPPTGKRGMYVDCMSYIIKEIHNGNYTNPVALLDYAQTNNFSYLALFGLDHNNDQFFPNGCIIGDPAFEPDVFWFADQAHQRGIEVGVVVSDKSFVQNNFTPRLSWNNLAVRSDCFSSQAKTIINPGPSPDERAMLKAEMSKAALRTANYNSQAAFAGGYIDFISVEYEYWTSGFFTDHPSYQNSATHTREYFAYMDLLDLLGFIRQVVCSGKYAGLRSEMELRLKEFPAGSLITVPHPQVQAIDIDRTKVDRILVVDYHRNVNALFGYCCANLHWLGHPSTMKRTEIWPLFSAETIALTKSCFGNSTGVAWGDFLGDFLLSGGTMADIENHWYNDLNSAGPSSCSNCNCNFSNGDNHVGGFMWFTSSILFTNSVQRKAREVQSVKAIRYDHLQKKLFVMNGNNGMLTVRNMSGRICLMDNSSSELNVGHLPSGVYICDLVGTDATTTEKFIITN